MKRWRPSKRMKSGKRKKKELKNRRDSRHRKWQEDFLHSRRHCFLWRHRTWAENGTGKFAWGHHSECKPVRLCPYDEKKRAMTQSSLDDFFKRVELNPATNQNLCINARHKWTCSLIPSPVAGNCSALPSPTPRPPPVSTLLACSLMPAPVCQLLYCTTYCTFQATIL